MIRFAPSLPLLFVTAALLVGCGGGSGDAPSTPPADPYGDCARLTEVVGPAEWVDPADPMSMDCAAPPNKTVCVSGTTIVAIDSFDETGTGSAGNYYVEDSSEEPELYSGMTVFGPTFSPPDLRLAEGDVVDMNGVQSEFLGPTNSMFGQCRTLPELSGTLSFRFDGSRPIAPKVIDDASVLKTYEGARPYLGMLVKVSNLKLAGDGADGTGNSAGRYTAPIDVGGGIPQSDVPFISNELFDLKVEGPPLVEGATFKSVTGVVTYFYGFKLAPRSAADFEP